MRPYEYVVSPERLPEVAERVLKASAVALDLETAKVGGGASTDPITGRIRLCSLNTGQHRYVLDLYGTGGLGPVAKALAETGAVIVGQNLKFDQKWLLWHYGLELQRLFDCYRASSLLYAGIPNLHHDLWSLYRRELKEEPKVEELGGSDWDAPELTQSQLDYAADDVDKLLRLREVLKPKLIKENLAKIAQIEFQAILPEAAIELNGFYLDAEMWKHRTAQDEARRRALEAVLLDALPNPHPPAPPPPEPVPEIQGVFAGVEPPKKKGRVKKIKPPPPFNVDSPAQILKSLQAMGVTQKFKDPETGQTSVVPLRDTKEVTLAMEADRWPIIAQLIEYRGYAQAVKTFGEEYLKNIHPVTGRIHCSFFPYTDAGRYACVAPWTPVRTRDGEKPIVDVQVGDEVWTHKERWRKVTAFLPQGQQQTFSVRFSNGNTLTCTASHKLLLSDGRWKTVEEVGRCARTPSDALFAGEGQPVVGVEEIRFAGSLEVYDLTVAEDESYETYGIFSHNCRSPNLQQVPRGNAFRECFRAQQGRKLAICDWSNIEMRLVAEISNDKTLIKVFQDERDAHYATAALLSGKTEKEVTKTERQQAKPVNFGFIYGMQAARLVLYAKAGYGVSLSEPQAKKFRKRFFEAYEGIAAWHSFALDSGKRRGETRTLWGRRRIIKDFKAHNEFFNSPVQGSGADGLKNSLRVVYDKLRHFNGGMPPLLAKGAKVGMVHMVHDEIILEHADEPGLAEAAQKALYDGMIEGMAPMMGKVPTAAECGGGDSWAAK